MYSGCRTKIASGKLKSEPRRSRRICATLAEEDDTIVGRSIPKTREINLPMSYVCKRRPFQLLNCHGSLPSVESRETFELPQRAAGAGAILSCLLCSLKLHVIPCFNKYERSEVEKEKRGLARCRLTLHARRPSHSRDETTAEDRGKTAGKSANFSERTHTDRHFHIA